MLLFHKTGHPLPTFPPISSSTAGPHPPQVTEHGSRNTDPRVTGHGSRNLPHANRRPLAPNSCPRAQGYLLGTFPLFASRTAPRGGTVGLQIKSVVQRLQRGLRTPTCRTVGYV